MVSVGRSRTLADESVPELERCSGRMYHLVLILVNFIEGVIT